MTSLGTHTHTPAKKGWSLLEVGHVLVVLHARLVRGRNAPTICDKSFIDAVGEGNFRCEIVIRESNGEVLVRMGMTQKPIVDPVGPSGTQKPIVDPVIPRPSRAQPSTGRGATDSLWRAPPTE